MGKYMKKSKAAGDVAALMTEAPPQSSSSSPLGVRTRARTLAAAALYKPSPPSSPQIPDASYLQLRSRRLLKVPPPLPPPPPPPPAQPRNCCGQTNPAGSRLQESPVKTVSFSVSGGEDVDVSSFGENLLEVEARDRSTRESTPCSSTSDSNANHTPGSTTRQRSHQIIHGRMQRSIPTAYEMEEFFAYAEKKQQTTFMHKYNFDITNDVPLPGRYEWVPVLNQYKL